MVIRTGLVIVTLLVLTATTVSASVWIAKGTKIHVNGTLVTVVWDTSYISQQPCAFGKDYFVVGGVKWIYSFGSEATIIINKYDPSEYYNDNGSGFVFTVVPKNPCQFTIVIEGLPVGNYVLIKNNSIESSSVKLSSSNKIVINDYITSPTVYTLKICKFEAPPKEVPIIYKTPKKCPFLSPVYTLTIMILSVIIYRRLGGV